MKCTNSEIANSLGLRVGCHNITPHASLRCAPDGLLVHTAHELRKLAPLQGAGLDGGRFPVVSLRSTAGSKLASRRDTDTGKFAFFGQSSSANFALSANRDAGGIKAGGRWLSGATPPEHGIRFIRTPAGVPARRAA